MNKAQNEAQGDRLIIDKATGKLWRWLVAAGVVAVAAVVSLAVMLPAQLARNAADSTTTATMGVLCVLAVPLLVVLGVRRARPRELVLDESGIQWRVAGSTVWSARWPELAGTRLDRGTRDNASADGSAVRYRVVLLLKNADFAKRHQSLAGSFLGGKQPSYTAEPVLAEAEAEQVRQAVARWGRGEATLRGAAPSVRAAPVEKQVPGPIVQAPAPGPPDREPVREVRPVTIEPSAANPRRAFALGGGLLAIGLLALAFRAVAPAGLKEPLLVVTLAGVVAALVVLFWNSPLSVQKSKRTELILSGDRLRWYGLEKHSWWDRSPAEYELLWSELAAVRVGADGGKYFVELVPAGKEFAKRHQEMAHLRAGEGYRLPGSFSATAVERVRGAVRELRPGLIRGEPA
ncbi:hypothetical protein [Amycolatopsis nigrescens]|uniref:hypothetical protein n=1 Tax=Amycolatopsis nigrescens TaxID=381445 RepID=UPI00037C937B|nr:hypothetical protein [Amycolatopsis nigrescens]